MWKLTRYLVAFIPISIALVSPFSDPIKRKFVNQYDLRWYISDPKRRTRTIATHNDGNTTLPKLRVELEIPSSTTRVVSDFDFSAFDSGQRASLLDALAHPDCLAHLGDRSERGKIVAVLDEHSTSRTLYDVDNAFHEILIARLEAAKVDRHVTEGFKQYAESHGSWLQKCGSNSAPHRQCNLVGSILEAWEYSKRDFQRAALKKWQDETGIEITVPQGKALSPDGTVPFAFALAADETRFLRISFGHTSVEPFATVSSSTADRITEVNSVDDLSASSFYILAKYYTQRTIIFAVLILGIGLIVLPYVIPVQLRSVHNVFNIARRTNDYEVWAVAFQKHRAVIVRIFRELRDEFGRRNISIGAEELFDSIRYDLWWEYKETRRLHKQSRGRSIAGLFQEHTRHPIRYNSVEDLNEDIRRQLLNLDLFL